MTAPVTPFSPVTAAAAPAAPIAFVADWAFSVTHLARSGDAPRKAPGRLLADVVALAEVRRLALAALQPFLAQLAAAAPSSAGTPREQLRALPAR
jgi:hypothetical protein